MEHRTLTVDELLIRLININSVTGSELEIGQFLFNHLSTLGFEVTKQQVAENRFNVFATLGTPRIFLQAHMDVVPPYIPASEDSEYIYGRGACDTKGCISAMLTAAEQAVREGVSDFGLLFTVGEETNFAGAYAAAERVKNLGVFLIVGEPTNLKPISAHYGFLSFRVICSGKTAHSSLPHLGENAIDKLIDVLSGPARELQIHPETLLSVVDVRGGVADNVIPDQAEALFSMRIAPGDSTNYVEEMQSLVGDRAVVEQQDFIPPVLSSVPEQLRFVGEGTSIKGCTELSCFQNGFIIGPGDIHNAHTENENILRSELRAAVELYLRILKTY